MLHWSHGGARALWTDKYDGSLGHKPPRGQHDKQCCGPDAAERRSKVRPGEWLRLVQVHGDAVVVATNPRDVLALQDSEADASVTNSVGVTLAIATADCAPIALASDEGIAGAVHAGWKGLRSGVLERTVVAMQMLGATRITAALGPCIHVECYEFGAAELDEFVQLWGSGVVGETSAGAPAFNLPAAVQAACVEADIELDLIDSACTACGNEHFSYRARQDSSRQVMLVWNEL